MALFTHKHTGNTMEIPAHNVAAYAAAGWVPQKRVKPVEVVPVPEIIASPKL
jgi:hypothetical protein